MPRAARRSRDSIPPSSGDTAKPRLSACRGSSLKGNAWSLISSRSAADVRKRIDEGWQFLAMQSELKMMVSRAQEIAAELGLETDSDLARY